MKLYKNYIDVLYELLLNIVSKNVKNNKNVNALWL